MELKSEKQIQLFKTWCFGKSQWNYTQERQGENDWNHTMSLIDRRWWALVLSPLKRKFTNNNGKKLDYSMGLDNHNLDIV